jgi:hypothetical protein
MCWRFSVFRSIVGWSKDELADALWRSTMTYESGDGSSVLASIFNCAIVTEPLRLPSDA